MIEHVEAEPKFLRHLLRAISHDRRRHVSAGFVRQIASEIDRLADDASAFGSALHGFLVGAVDHHRDGFQLALLLVFRSIFVGLEHSHDCTDDNHLRRGFRFAIGARNNRDRFQVLAAQKSRRGPAHLRNLGGLVRSPIAATDQQQTARL